jgi:ATP/maltotriose-dependent transcriptional regulator MalT
MRMIKIVCNNKSMHEFSSFLSPRQRSVLELVGEGRSNKEIARDLGISAETVKSHVKRIFEKLQVARRAQAVSRAQTLGILRMTPTLEFFTPGISYHADPTPMVRYSDALSWAIRS